jgi:cob(I)alamin adenosyltransferase
MSIATKTGDAGTTALMYGRRVSKLHPRVETYGTVDELNASLGGARATAQQQIVKEVIFAVQKELVTLMAELAVADEDRERFLKDGHETVKEEMVNRLTAVVDDLEKNHGITYKQWATPGQNLASAHLDIARTICRRAERRVVELLENRDYVNPETIRYLNRLSDVLWLFARLEEVG